MSDLLERFLADRAVLDADELATLTAELRADPALAGEARALLQLDELLSRRHAGDRGHFAKRVTTRLATADSGTFVRRVRKPLRLRRPRGGTPGPWLAAAAALLVVIAGWIVLQRGAGGDAPTLLVKDGTVTASGRTLATGATLHVGDHVQVNGSVATLTWLDGTRVELDAGARIVLTATTPKRLRLDTGVLRTDVAKQPAGAPMTVTTRDALATVLGTRLRIAVGRETRLDVLEGRVEFGDATTIQVGAGQMATCAAGQPPRLHARESLIAFGRAGRALPPGTLEDHREIFSAALGYGWERANDGKNYPDVTWQGGTRTSDRELVESWSAPDALSDSGLAVGWANHTDAWRMALPDGHYDVTVAVGGTAQDQGPHRVVIQGKAVVADVVTPARVVKELSGRVEVTDGWLRLNAGGTTAPASPTGDGSTDTILLWLRITAVE